MERKWRLKCTNVEDNVVELVLECREALREEGMINRQEDEDRLAGEQLL